MLGSERGRRPGAESAFDGDGAQAGGRRAQHGESVAQAASFELHERVPARRVWAKFAGYYRPYMPLFAADLACATVLAGIDLAFPQILSFFTGDFFLRPVSEIVASLLPVFALLLALYLLRTLCQWFVTRWGHVMGARMEADMRADLFVQYQRLGFDYYDRHNTGAMMSRITSDLFDISELAHHGPENLFICVLKIVGSFALLFMVNVPLTCVMLGVTAVMAALSFSLNYRKRTVFRENRARMAGINATVQDSLGGIRVVKSFGGERAEFSKFAEANRAFLETKERSYRFLGAFHGLNSLFMGLLYVVTIVGGGYFVAQGSLAVTDLAIYALYIGIFVAPVEQLVNFTETLQKGYAGFCRFMEVLAEEPSVRDDPDARPFEDVVRGEVRYDAVTFSYDGKAPVLDGLSLAVPAGTTVALVGPSGGGKTTTCSLLSRFYDVDAGSVTIDGRDVRSLPVADLRAAVGIVQQDVYLFGGTVRDNIAYGRPGAGDEEIVEAAKRASIHDFIVSLPQGYDTVVGERGARLSGGQKQRIAIARVFLKDPRILVLDEATSALDNESEQAIQRSLAALCEGRTTLVIAHRLSTIRGAQMIAVVEDGRVVEKGTHAELLEKSGTYARYYEMQFGRAD